MTQRIALMTSMIGIGGIDDNTSFNCSAFVLSIIVSFIDKGQCDSWVVDKNLNFLLILFNNEDKFLSQSLDPGLLMFTSFFCTVSFSINNFIVITPCT